MAFFLVVLNHYDPALRSHHMDAHIEWLDEMVRDGFVVVSGPLSAGPLANSPAAGALLVRADSKAEVLKTMAADPFFVHGATDAMTVTGWEPVFGLLAEQSQGREALRAAPGR